MFSIPPPYVLTCYAMTNKRWLGFQQRSQTSGLHFRHASPPHSGTFLRSLWGNSIEENRASNDPHIAPIASHAGRTIQKRKPQILNRLAASLTNIIIIMRFSKTPKRERDNGYGDVAVVINVQRWTASCTHFHHPPASSSSVIKTKTFLASWTKSESLMMQIRPPFDVSYDWSLISRDFYLVARLLSTTMRCTRENEENLNKLIRLTSLNACE